MKTKLLLASALLFFSIVNAQNNDHIVHIGSTGNPSSVYAGDFDGDGDMDVLSALNEDNTIAWNENADGLGNFNPKQNLSTNALGATCVFAADLDGDGDLDAISASANDDKIAWYENTDGQGNFGTAQNITTNAIGAYSVYAIDLDGDGDFDVLSASYGDDKIAWYENTDSQGSFGAQQVISTNADGATSVYSVDLDGDGDNDVLSASFGDSKVAWHENTDGQGNFGAEQIIDANFQTVEAIHADDLDGDGDMDVLASSWHNGISWYENTNGLGNFVFYQNVTPNFIAPNEVGLIKTADMDNDGDMDMVSYGDMDHLKPNEPSNMSNGAHKVAWYENTNGLGDFGYVQNIFANAWGLTSVYPADINGDGNMDVVSSSTDQDKIAWHENIILPPSSVKESAYEVFFAHPNPTSGILNIESKIPVKKLEVRNSLGQLVLSNSNKNQIDLSKLGQGVYFLKIKGENGKVGVQKVIKE